ncbi:hypothetical protein OC844_006005 [Tilletia horrida]|nr:hypothetical protein OC844_006005 [Tilletia horrida]
MNGLVSYSDDEDGSSDAEQPSQPRVQAAAPTAPPPAAPTHAASARSALGGTETVRTPLSVGVRKNLRGPISGSSRAGSTSSPLVVRPRNTAAASTPLVSSSRPTAASPATTSNAAAGTSASRSRGTTGHDAHSASAASTPLAPSEPSTAATTAGGPQFTPRAGGSGSGTSLKGKERALEADAELSPAEYEAAYRQACWPPHRSDGDQEWGLPPVPHEGADPALEARLANFHALKLTGTHFNSSLVKSRAFHNPHIYAKLVSFVDIEETRSNFPLLTRPGAWDSHDLDVLRQGDAGRIAAEQKRIAEEKQAAQATGKRSSIAFTSSSSSSATHHDKKSRRDRDRGRDRDQDRDRDHRSDRDHARDRYHHRDRERTRH